MFHSNQLRGKLAEKQITLSALARNIGICNQSVYRKMSGESDWSRWEIERIAAHLGLSGEQVMGIFFGGEGDRAS